MKQWPEDLQFARHNARVRPQAVAAFRARKQKRRTVRVILAMFLIASAGTFLAFWPISRTPTTAEAVFPASQIPNPEPKLSTSPTARLLASDHATPENSAEPAPVEILSDDELIALFPPGSCFLAEVDGHSRLVFRDPELQKVFIKRAN